MISLQIKSDVSGIWTVEFPPTGWLIAVHPDYDGAEDGMLDTVTAIDIYDLMMAVKEYDDDEGC